MGAAKMQHERHGGTAPLVFLTSSSRFEASAVTDWDWAQAQAQAYRRTWLEAQVGTAMAPSQS